METNNLATKLTRLSIGRKVTVFVLFLSILAVGLIATGNQQLGYLLVFRKMQWGLNKISQKSLTEISQVRIRSCRQVPLDGIYVAFHRSIVNGDV